MTTQDRPLEDDVARAVAALSAAARRTYTTAAGEARHDFGEVVTRVLAAVAANVGGVDQLLAGRPGSWEADGVRQLLVSTLGDEDRLLEHRTEPITVWIDVEAQLEQQTEGEWDAAWDRLTAEAEEAYEDAYEAALERHAGDRRIVSEEDRDRLDNSLSAPELPADVRAIWARVRDEAEWLVGTDPHLAAARRLTDSVGAAREAGERDYETRLLAAMKDAAVSRGCSVDLAPSMDYDDDNWLGNELEAQARAVTPVPTVPTLDELRSDPSAGE